MTSRQTLVQFAVGSTIPAALGPVALVKSYRGARGDDAAAKARDAGTAIDALTPGRAGGLGKRLNASAAMNG